MQQGRNAISHFVHSLTAHVASLGLSYQTTCHALGSILLRFLGVHAFGGVHLPIYGGVYP